MKMIQVELQRNDTHMTAWIEKRPSIKKGCYISLKGNKDIFWKVTNTYSVCDSSIIHSDWAVGGLNKRNFKTPRGEKGKC